EIQETHETQGDARNEGNRSEREGIHRVPAGGAAEPKPPRRPQTFPEFLTDAVRRAQQTTEDDECEGKWRSPWFQFARQLKAHPEVGRLPAAKAIEKIERIIRGWERDHKGWEFWLECFGVSRDDAHAEILDVWHQIRRLPGLDALANAA